MPQRTRVDLPEILAWWGCDILLTVFGEFDVAEMSESSALPTELPGQDQEL
jgi:hypothetical protein